MAGAFCKGQDTFAGWWQFVQRACCGGLSASTRQVINLSIQAGSGRHGMSLLIPWPANCCVLWFVKMSGRKKKPPSLVTGDPN